MRSRCRIGRRLAVLACSALLAGVAPAVAVEPEVSGRVLDDAGLPARGAVIELGALRTHYEAALAAWRGEPEPTPAVRATADAGGAFSLRAPQPGFWKVVVRAPGFVAAEYPLEPLLEDVHLADLQLVSDQGIEVEVVAPARDGSPPAPDAALERSARKLPAAWIEVASIGGSKAEPYATGAWHSTRRMAWASALPATVRLPRAAGEAVEVRVAVPGGGFPVVATSDGSGRFARPQGASITAGSSSPPPAPGAAPASSGAAAATGRSILRVGEEGGAAVASALVCAGNLGLPLGLTDAEGRVELYAQAAEILDLMVLAADGRARSFKVRPEERRDRVAALTMPRAEAVAGKVVDDADSSPLPGAFLWARLRWRDAGPTGLGEAVLGDLGLLARTDAAGRFDLRVGGDAQVGAAAAGYFPRDVVSRGPGFPGSPPRFTGKPTSVRLRRSRWVAGTVVEMGGQPVAGVLVIPFRGPAQSFNTTRSITDAQGRFRLGGWSGSGRIVALARGFAPTIEQVDLGDAPSRSDVRIVLRRGRLTRGRVVDLEQRAVAGARVRLEEATASGGEFFPRGYSFRKSPAVLASTAADGTFELGGVASGIYDVTVDAAGFAITGVPGLEIADGEGDVDLGTFMVGPGVVIEGLVVDREGGPLAGAAVTIFNQGPFQRIRESAGPEPWSAWLNSSPSGPAAVESDADGRFVLRDVNPSEKVDLSVSLEGYLPTRVPQVAGPTDEPVRVVLEAAAAVRGRVADENGEPVSGATVTASGVSMPDRKTAHGGDDGAFELAKLKAGSWRLEATAAGYELVDSPTLDLKGGAAKEGVVLTMREKEHGSVDGRVVDQDGAAVPGAQVMVYGARSAQTGDDGAFHLERVPLGPQEIRAMASGGRNAVKTVEVREGLNTVELTLESGVDVGGRVVDQDGNGVTGAMVSLTVAGGPTGGAVSASRGVLTMIPRTVRSAAGGAFLIPRVADGVYALQAVLEGQSRARYPGELRVAGSPIQGLELVLEKGAGISGTLTGLDFDQLSQVKVFAGSEHGGGPGRVIGSEYEVANLEPGEYRVAGDVRQHGLHAEGRVTVEAGAQARLDLDFEGGLTLSGLVTRRGEPAVGSVLSLRGLDVAAQRSATIDVAGAYLLRGLEAGVYELTVRAGGQGSRVPWVRRIELHDDTELPIELGGSRVTGVVVDASSGDPIPGATVRMRRAAGTGDLFADERRSGAAGEFVYDDVPEGSFTVEATADRYATGSVQIEVRAGAEVEGVVLELEPSSGLTLRVTAPSGPPLWIQTMLVDGAGRPLSAPMRLSPRAMGVFEVPGVAEGNWGLLVGGGGLATVRIGVVVPGPPVDVALPPAARVEVEIPALIGGSAVAELQVLDAAGRPFLSMDGGGGIGVWRVESGRVFVEGMPAGQWILRASALDGSTWSGVAATAPGSTSQARLQ